jgi:hemerythrin
MALFQWNSEYSVGISRFDSQHKRLIELLNQLHEGMRAGYGRKVLLNLLHALQDYTQHHCAEEELAMAFYRYPQAAEHRAEHDELRARIAQYLAEFEANKLNKIDVEMVNFVLQWLTQHIMGVDRKYCEFFTEHSVERALRTLGSNPDSVAPALVVPSADLPADDKKATAEPPVKVVAQA